MKWDASSLDFALPLWSIKSYLKTNGWTYEEPWGDRGSIHVKAIDGASWEVLVPIDDTASDYALATARIVSMLAETEERSEFRVFSELAATGSDVIRISSTNGYKSSALSIVQSSALHGNARDLLGQAARSAEQPKAAYLGRYSDVVRNYLESVIPITDLADGYALSLHSPVAPRIAEQREFEDADYGSFARKTTSKLAAALSCADAIVKQLYAQDKVPDDYDEAVSAGLSANLCESIASLAKSGHGIEIDMSWAPTRPVKTLTRPARFSQDAGSILHQLAQDIRNKQPSFR